MVACWQGIQSLLTILASPFQQMEKGYIIMEETLRITEENGKPELRMKGSLGEVIVVFAEQESESDLKKGLLQLILQSYEDRVLGTKSDRDAS